MKNRKKRHHGSKKRREHRRRKNDKSRRKKRQKEEDTTQDEPCHEEGGDQNDEDDSETETEKNPNIYIKKRMFHPDVMMHWCDAADPRRNTSFRLFDPLTRHDDVPPPSSFPFPEMTLTTMLPRGPLRGYVVHSPGLGLFEIDLGQFLPQVVFNTYEYIEDNEGESSPVKKQGHFYLCKLVNFRRRFQATPDKIHDLQKIIHRLLNVSDGWVEVRVFGIDRYWKLLVDIEFPGFLGSLRTWLLDEAGDVVERFNK